MKENMTKLEVELSKLQIDKPPVNHTKIRRDVIDDAEKIASDLEMLATTLKQIQNGQDPDIGCLLGIGKVKDVALNIGKLFHLRFLSFQDPDLPEESKTGREIDMALDDQLFHHQVSACLKRSKVSASDIRQIVSDRYADSMALANQSGCISQ